MSRELFHSLEVIKYATEEIRREKWRWDDMREAQKLRWRPDTMIDDQPRDTSAYGWPGEQVLGQRR